MSSFARCFLGVAPALVAIIGVACARSPGESPSPPTPTPTTAQAPTPAFSAPSDQPQLSAPFDVGLVVRRVQLGYRKVVDAWPRHLLSAYRWRRAPFSANACGRSIQQGLRDKASGRRHAHHPHRVDRARESVAADCVRRGSPRIRRQPQHRTRSRHGARAQQHRRRGRELAIRYGAIG